MAERLILGAFRYRWRCPECNTLNLTQAYIGQPIAGACAGCEGAMEADAVNYRPGAPQNTPPLGWILDGVQEPEQHG